MYGYPPCGGLPKLKTQTACQINLPQRTFIEEVVTGQPPVIQPLIQAIANFSAQMAQMVLGITVKNAQSLM